MAFREGTLGSTLASTRQVGANPRSAYYPALDGLRAVAVGLVFLAHYAAHYFEWGWIGVDIFFVLSGFLITGVLSDARDTVHRFRDFYARRALRIFPLYYAIWLLFALLTPVLHIVWRPLNLLWPAYLGNWIPLFQSKLAANPNLDHVVAMLPGHANPLVLFTGHFWSLCVEEQFYFIWPLVVFTVRERITLLRICMVVCVVSPLLRLLIMHWMPASFTNDGAFGSITFLRLDEFLIGGLAALTMRGPRPERLRKVAPWLFAGGALVLLATYMYGRLRLHMQYNLLGDRHWALGLGITVVDLMGLGMVLLCLDRASWMARLLNLRPLRAVGKISYGFYVLHDIPHSLYADAADRLRVPGTLATSLIAFAGTLLLSLASYRFLEVTFLRMKTRFDPVKVGTK